MKQKRKEVERQMNKKKAEEGGETGNGREKVWFEVGSGHCHHLIIFLICGERKYVSLIICSQ